MQTRTPRLDASVLERLSSYGALFSDAFRRKGQSELAQVYLVGLLHDGDRKSVEPLVNRVWWLAESLGEDPVQAVWHFVSKGKWSDESLLAVYRKHLRELSDSPEALFVLDDTSFAKKGKHSVGVAPQYCGSLGKQANCQVAVSLHYVTPAGHYPLSMRLQLPEVWTSDEQRLDKACVPAEHRRYKTRHEIALELLDQALAEGHQARKVCGDVGYGNSAEFRAALVERGLTYAVGVQGESVAFTSEPHWLRPGDPSLARNQRNPKLSPDNPRPESLDKIACKLAFRRCKWRTGTKGKLQGSFAVTRVWPAKDWQDGRCADAEPVWLIVEQRGDELRYHFSNAPKTIAFVELIRLLKSRWPVEQGYQQLKEELGLDHFECRSWVGLHHHICLTFLAYGFLELERRRIARSRPKPVPQKKARNTSPHCPPYAALSR